MRVFVNIPSNDYPNKKYSGTWVTCWFTISDKDQISLWVVIDCKKKNLILNKTALIPMHQKNVSHDPSEIILICWFAAQETFIIINVENICAA